MIKLFNYIILFLVTASIGAGISYGKLYLFHVLFVLLFIFILYAISKGYKLKKAPSNFHIFLNIMFLWYAISVLWVHNKVYYLFYMFYLIMGVSIVLVMVYFVNNLDKQTKLFKWLAIIFCFQFLVSFLEITGVVRWPISPFSNYIMYFGRESAISASLGANAIRILNKTPTGFQWNPNNLAGVLLIALPFFLYIKKIIVNIVGLFSIICILVYIGSRAAFLALCVSLSFWFMKENRLWYKRVFLFCSIFFILAVGLFKDDAVLNYKINRLMSSGNSISRFFDYSKQEQDSIGVRRQLTANAMEALMESPLLGVGAGNSKSVQEEKNNTLGVTSLHNFWLELVVEGGCIFGCLFVLWYFFIIYSLLMVYKRTSNYMLKYYSIATATALVGYSIAMVSSSSVIYNLTMWLTLGFAIITINNYKIECLKNIK